MPTTVTSLCYRMLEGIFLSDFTSRPVTLLSVSPPRPHISLVTRVLLLNSEVDILAFTLTWERGSICLSVPDLLCLPWLLTKFLTFCGGPLVSTSHSYVTCDGIPSFCFWGYSRSAHKSSHFSQVSAEKVETKAHVKLLFGFHRWLHHHQVLLCLLWAAPLKGLYSFLTIGSHRIGQERLYCYLIGVIFLKDWCSLSNLTVTNYFNRQQNRAYLGKKSCF